MDRTMMTSATTMAQLQKGIDLISNNISNLSTTGYKSRSATFQSLLFQNMTDQPDKNQNLGRVTPLGIREGNGARLSDTQMDMSVGALNPTGRPLDLALTNADHFFTIGSGDAPRYTRDGTFYLSPDATNPNTMNLTTANGQFVLDQNGNPVQIPAHFEDINIDAAGKVTYTMPGGGKGTAGELGIVDIKRPQLLEAQGDNTFTLPNLASLGLTQNDVLAPNNGALVVRQGFLESSNVDLSDQMTNLMTMERAYQFNARSLRVGDDMMNLINQLK